MKNLARRLLAGVAVLALTVAQSEAAYIGPLPIGVTAGGTGQITLTNHSVLLGQGTAAVVGVGPGATAGVALVSGGGSADPSFTTVLAVGGGTGLSSPAAHSMVVTEGSSNYALLSAAADSVPLWQSASADPTVTAINNCATALTYSTGSHTFGCNAGIVSPSVTLYTSTLPVTLSSTNLVTTVSNMASPAAGVYNLPASPSANTRACLKDGTTDFSANAATVKTTDSSTIDGTAGATGVVINQKNAETCFIFSTNWYIE